MMKQILQIEILLFCLLPLIACNGQSDSKRQQEAQKANSAIVGGGCDGCELMFVGIPDTIEAIDYSPAWNEKGQKLLVTGFIYEVDGKTPAANVVLYYWQTNSQGLYATKKGMDQGAKKHGYIRGWVKSDENGKYSIYTIRPQPYPNQASPAHIHISVKEPSIPDEYYIDAFVFEDDLLLNSSEREKMENRGGSGILNIRPVDDLQIAEHNIILGLNIPHYPKH